MRLLARASTPAKGDALAALELAKDFLGERHVRGSSFGGNRAKIDTDQLISGTVCC